MRTEQNAEDRKERLLYGCLLGLILFASSAIYVSVFVGTEMAKAMLPYTPAALVGYLALGILLIWAYTKPHKGEMGVWFNGSAAVYIIDLVAGAVVFVSFFLPQFIRYMILINVAIILLCWFLDYRYFVKVAKELNGGKKNISLVVDIQDCPRSEEAFCREIEDYCRKTGRRLEFIKRGKQAEIRMDGELYTVELDSFYSLFGPMYALKFKQRR